MKLPDDATTYIWAQILPDGRVAVGWENLGAFAKEGEDEHQIAYNNVADGIAGLIYKFVSYQEEANRLPMTSIFLARILSSLAFYQENVDDEDNG